MKKNRYNKAFKLRMLYVKIIGDKIYKRLLTLLGPFGKFSLDNLKELLKCMVHLSQLIYMADIYNI